MKKILIADAGKASMVLTSEVFKDHFVGVQVVVAKSSAEVLEIAKNDTSLDAIVIDYDLPDRDGAQTASRIKKFSQVPILMTGFDRSDVQENIEQELSAYEDCLNWIRKPVKPDLVVEIAKRYCEGRYRTKRRIPCEVPAFFELAVEVKTTLEAPATTMKAKSLQSKKVIDKKAKPKKSAKEKVVTTIKKTRIPVLIMDCSLGGLKVRVSRERVAAMSLGKFATDAVNAIAKGEVLSIHLPEWNEIIATRPAGKMVAEKTAPQNAMRGKVAWMVPSVDRGSWTLGVQCENLTLSKKLFDSVLQTMRSHD
jgi:CheY-like chemotaxis protein